MQFLSVPFCILKFMKNRNRLSIFLIVVFAVLDIALWLRVLVPTQNGPRFYFLDVGQGDSELVILPGGVKVLTDAGPADRQAANQLDMILGDDRYIDLGVITHPQLDHFGGYLQLLTRYRFGAILINGRSDSPGVDSWTELMKAIEARHIPFIVAGRGDSVNYQKNKISILSPSPAFRSSGELNDTGIVELFNTPPLRALFTADTGFAVEQDLMANFDIRADLLKVGHHGSKYSSSEEFLRAVDPKVAVIEVGLRNRYGHPAPVTLGRLASSTLARVLRTDNLGNIEIFADGQTIKAFADR
jgi:competence protein ComEC